MRKDVSSSVPGRHKKVIDTSTNLQLKNTRTPRTKETFSILYSNPITNE